MRVWLGSVFLVVGPSLSSLQIYQYIITSNKPVPAGLLFLLRNQVVAWWVDYFPSHFSEVFSYYLFQYFLRSFLPSGTPVMGTLVCLMLAHRSLRLSSFLFSLFFSCILFCGSDFHCFVFQVPVLLPLLLLISSIVFVCFRSLVNSSCLFSIFASILFPRFCVIFTIILNSFSGKMVVSTSFTCFSGVLCCLFTWDITVHFHAA